MEHYNSRFHLYRLTASLIIFISLILLFPSKYALNQINMLPHSYPKQSEIFINLNKTWGGANDDVSNGIWGDGTYIYTCGWTASYGSGNKDALLMKWNATGNIIWNKTWDNSSMDELYSVWANSSVIFTCGGINSSSTKDKDALLIQWDINGNAGWNRTWGASMSGWGDDEALAIWSDGTGLFTTGYSTTFNNDLFLARWNASGSIKWMRAYQTILKERANAIWGNSTNIFTCGISVDLSNTSKILLINWNVTGEKIWSRTAGINNSGMAVWGVDDSIYTTGNCNTVAGHSDVLLTGWFPGIIHSTADFTVSPNTLVLGHETLFYYTGIPGDNLVSSFWNFDDGTNTTDLSPVVHTYLSSGSYNVSLNITDIDGYSSLAYLVLVVENDTVPFFKITSNQMTVITGEWVDFSFTGSEGNSPVAYFWDFGDGQKSTQKSPVHQFMQASVYNVTLTITDFDGDTCTASQTITVTNGNQIDPGILLFVIVATLVIALVGILFTITRWKGRARVTSIGTS